MQFGKLDRTDFLISPFALFYFYLFFVHAFGWPSPTQSALFESKALGWLGVILCLLGLGGLVWSLVSFWCSFRVGIDTTTPGSLVPQGCLPEEAGNQFQGSNDVPISTRQIFDSCSRS